MSRFMRQLSPILRCFILFVCVGCPMAAGQGQTPVAGGLRVVVKEAQGLPLAGASCSLATVPQGKTPIAATSDEQGTVRFTNVSPGRYTLTVAKEGFEIFARSEVVIDEKPENEIVVILKIAAGLEYVRVM